MSELPPVALGRRGRSVSPEVTEVPVRTRPRRSSPPLRLPANMRGQVFELVGDDPDILHFALGAPAPLPASARRAARTRVVAGQAGLLGMDDFQLSDGVSAELASAGVPTVAPTPHTPHRLGIALPGTVPASADGFRLIQASPEPVVPPRPQPRPRPRRSRPVDPEEWLPSSAATAATGAEGSPALPRRSSRLAGHTQPNYRELVAFEAQEEQPEYVPIGVMTGEERRWEEDADPVPGYAPFATRGPRPPAREPGWLRHAEPSARIDTPASRALAAQDWGVLDAGLLEELIDHHWSEGERQQLGIDEVRAAAAMAESFAYQRIG
jgi:hypothetical protein